MTNAITSEEGLNPEPNISADLSSEQEQSQGNFKFGKASSEPAVQPLESELQIVHAVPGRIRLRVTGNNELKSILDNISQQLRQQAGVKEVSTNQQTGSLIITFDQNTLSLPQILGLLQELGVSEPKASLQSEKEIDPFATWKSAEFWKEQGIEFIPLITGLLVTGGLGIHGLPAIPVYLVAAGATRQVIDQTRGQGSENVVPSPQEATNNTQSEHHFPEPSNETGDLGAQPAKIAYKVVHAIPGRIRFNVPRIAQDQGYARRLQKLLKADAQVASVRVNSAAASIIISYQPGEILVSHWVSLIQSADEAIAPTNSTTAATQQPLPDKIQPTPINSTTATEQSKPEATSIWAELKPPALSASLAFIANLPLEAVPE